MDVVFEKLAFSTVQLEIAVTFHFTINDEAERFLQWVRKPYSFELRNAFKEAEDFRIFCKDWSPDDWEANLSIYRRVYEFRALSIWKQTVDTVDNVVNKNGIQNCIPQISTGTDTVAVLCLCLLESVDVVQQLKAGLYLNDLERVFLSLYEQLSSRASENLLENTWMSILDSIKRACDVQDLSRHSNNIENAMQLLWGQTTIFGNISKQWQIGIRSRTVCFDCAFTNEEFYIQETLALTKTALPCSVAELLQLSQLPTLIQDGICTNCSDLAPVHESNIIQDGSPILIISLNNQNVPIDVTQSLTTAGKTYQIYAIVSRIGEEIDNPIYTSYIQLVDREWVEWSPREGYRKEVWIEKLPRKYYVGQGVYGNWEEAVLLFCSQTYPNQSSVPSDTT